MSSDLLLRRTPTAEEQLRQPLGAVAHRLAVHFEDVAELDPAVAGRRAHEQHVGLQVAPLAARFRREPAQVGAAGAAHLLAVGFLGDDPDERRARRLAT